jgi:hypothetical protein
VLLSEPSFVEFLKNDVIPSWENVRDPVKVALNMGDGRTVHRTIGGNTALYLVAPNGYVVDAFPGVYRPEDLLPELAKSLQIADRSTSDWIKFHRDSIKTQVLRPRLNEGKMVVEAPVIEKLGLTRPPTADSEQVIDESHFPLTREEVRLLVGASDKASDQEVANNAVTIDSLTNIRDLRPLVHAKLARNLRTPADLKLEMFKELLDVPIDDPNLGLTNVLTPGGG